MNYNEIMNKLKELGTEQNIKIYKRHGCDISLYGVSIAHLKDVYKIVKNDKNLGLKLLHSGNYDAMYLSQWMIDANTLTISDILLLMNTTAFYVILENVIPNIVIKNKNLTWELLPILLISDNPRHRSCGYSLYSLIVATYPNDEIDFNDVERLLLYIETNIHSEENRVKYTMNGFVISTAIYIPELTVKSRKVSESIGKVSVFMGKTSCKVPYGPDYIDKVIKMNRVGKKRV